MPKGFQPGAFQQGAFQMEASYSGDPGTPWLCYDNRAIVPGTAITPSSQQASAPAAWLRDPLLALKLRTKAGYDVVAGRNDRIDLVRGATTYVVQLTAANYATPAAHAAHVQARLQAADGGNAYTCSYSSLTKKFTIAGTAAFSMLWQSGPNAARSAGVDLGFYVAADDAGVNSYVADGASFQSRRWIDFDLGAAPGAVQIAIARGHNSGWGGVWRILADHAANWAAPAISFEMTGNDLVRLFAGQVAASYRYWSMLIDDVQNADGFVELSVPYLGPRVELRRSQSLGWSRGQEDLSSFDVADFGAHYQNRRSRRSKYPYSFVCNDSEVVNLEALELAVRVGGCFFYAPSPLADPHATRYVYLRAPLEISDMDRAEDDDEQAFRVTVDMAEVLS